MFKWGMIALLALLSMPLEAAGDELKKGDDAPKFKVGGRVIHPPEFARDLNDCEGKIVVIMEWNRRDSSKDWLTDVEPLWKKYGGHALMVFAIHRLKDTEWNVRSYLKSSKITLPCCMGYFYDEKNEFTDYSATEGKFAACVIGLDQKIAHWSTTESPAKIAQELLKAAEYQGLQKQDYAMGAKSSAAAFSSQKFGRALNEAKKVMDGEFKDEEKEDAEYVHDRAQARADARQSKIDSAKESGRWDIYKENLTLNRQDFAGHEIGDAAKEALKAFKKDKTIKRERDAFEQLDKLKSKNEGKEPHTQSNGLRAFARAAAGTKAADVAKKIAAEIDTWKDET
ncbi:hypothetical protein OAU50_00290 [Planctomycetota bacterium]|nr:hypothetical protein [Planctomycetota bacterium]